MIISPDFVFISNPRTGSTFARKVIKAAYAYHPVEQAGDEPVQELILPVSRGSGRTGSDHHGTVSQIPRDKAHLPAISVVRNPYTHLVSLFELGRWRRDLTVQDHDQNAPFETFLRVQEEAAERRWALPGKPGFGPMSLHFLQMFARDADAAFGDLRAGRTHGAISRHLSSITLLRQERLRDDLRDALAPFVSDDGIHAIETMPPSHVTRRSRSWTRGDFDSRIAGQIRSREAFLFELLAQRGHTYTLDNADFTQCPAPQAAS